MNAFDTTENPESVENPNRIIIKKRVPFQNIIIPNLNALGLSAEAVNDKIPQRFKASWLAWQLSRVSDNPYFNPEKRNQLPVVRTAWGSYNLDTARFNETLPTTGFEGYFIEAENATDAAKQIAQIGAGIIRSMKIFHSNDPGFVSRAIRILLENETSKQGDSVVLDELFATFGAAVNRLRTTHITNKPSTNTGRAYRDETYREIGKILPTFKYNLTPDGWIEEYQLPKQVQRTTLLEKGRRGIITWANLNSEERKGYFLMSGVGRLGNPLLRLAMSGLAR